jgi:K+-transporting ATPase ATPase C chain
LILFTLVTGVVYPLVVTGIARACFNEKAHGSVIVTDGREVGSALIGQQFTDAKYFWPRPSATSPVPYAADAGSGSNMAQSNPALAEAVRQRAAALHAVDPENTREIPADLLYASGSGLDPHISVAAAEYQVQRVAGARQMHVDSVRLLVERATEDRTLGCLGEPRVNVLRLNLALDGH